MVEETNFLQVSVNKRSVILQKLFNVRLVCCLTQKLFVLHNSFGNDCWVLEEDVTKTHATKDFMAFEEVSVIDVTVLSIKNQVFETEWNHMIQIENHPLQHV